MRTMLYTKVTSMLSTTGIASEKYASGSAPFRRVRYPVPSLGVFVLQSLRGMPFGVHHRHCGGNSVDNGRGEYLMMR